MEILREDAPAKVNLTLKVLGKRADGYHEIYSLAVFSRVCDQLELLPGKSFSLKVDGPFAAALSTHDNLIEKAVSLFLQKFPIAGTGAFTLDKQLPVAAGLGGGSADAAAALKLLARANLGVTDSESLSEIASRLGSDVSVCLQSRATLMKGRGDEITVLEGLPTLPAVLVYPDVELGTAEVYEALDAPPLDSNAAASCDGPTSPAKIDSIAQYITSFGNDLQAPAMKFAPVIGDVFRALTGTKGCLAAQMSGSGTTCFGVYADGDAARLATKALMDRHPGWWIRETELS